MDARNDRSGEVVFKVDIFIFNGLLTSLYEYSCRSDDYNIIIFFFQ